MEFHVSKKTRDRYKFDLSIYNLRGNVIFANFYAARSFADQINKTRDLVRFPEQAVRPGKINAMGLVDELLHVIIRQYLDQVNPHAIADAVGWLESQLDPGALELTLLLFSREFPPVAVYRQELSVEEYLNGSTDGVSNKEHTLEELIALWLANNNPAFSQFIELFDDSSLRKNSSYRDIFESLNDFFDLQPSFGAEAQSLLDLLQTPARKFPHSLEGQLSFLLENWGHLLGDYVYRILSSLDLIQEEQKASFMGPGPVPIPDFTQADSEPERFSLDLDWMPDVILIAKNVYVWLHQLSKGYSKPITRLDQIPDEELEKLRNWGITGLWLIGLWERSPASKKIKRLMGNQEAEASAYSLYSYQIASDLGGDDAYLNLKNRASDKGVRLASDMVPNHMGIDSPWVVEHPDWFISLDHSPFPAYSFNGIDLSSNSSVGIFIEDHYFDQSDAAVVFRRLDRERDRNQFIYHGNDGTSTPWNDTAQINFLNAEAREAVIQTILHVARKFSIIRFDAAMTLAKRHYLRLWFPEPGTGGAIPSRAGLGLSKSQFDQLMPVEFWREVVDRVAQEVPDTLLLAEAFWLMEGYFVRTLGMHRVYNSAFMHMLRDEENANYRSVMKNTLQFDPEILKRFVNFMNNPDERTAVDQFGKGDKYIGICILMSTLPGLPMFGHGQIEGLTEKYGMEFRKPAWEEESDPHLINRHEREIFPLLHRRNLFAGVENFLLYDFVTPSGHTNEDVFAFSNQVGNDRALVIFHNRYAETQGSLKTSVAFADKSTRDGEKTLRQKSLSEGLGLSGNSNSYCIYKDQLSGLEYIRSCKQLAEHGLDLSLQAYKAHVFINIHEVYDETGSYAELDRYMNGRGVPSIEESHRELLLRPIHGPIREAINPEFFIQIRDIATKDESIDFDLLETPEIMEKIQAIYAGADQFSKGSGQIQELIMLTMIQIRSLLEYSKSGRTMHQDQEPLSGALAHADPMPADQFYLALSWILTHSLGRVVSEQDSSAISRAWMDEWMLAKLISRTFLNLGLSEDETHHQIQRLKALIVQQDWYSDLVESANRAYQLFSAILRDPDSAACIGVNRYRDVLWINQEGLESLLDWMAFIHQIQSDSQVSEPGQESELSDSQNLLDTIRKVANDAGYQVESILKELENIEEL